MQRPKRITPTDQTDTPSLRILVAEDNKTNQAMVAALLNNLGHQIDIVSHGIDAVAAVRKDVYDVVLMDIHMPELDGIQALKIIRDLNEPAAELPIIAVTADAMQGDREKYLALGFSDYVSKPIVRADLQRALGRCLGLWLDTLAAERNCVPAGLVSMTNAVGQA